ncbi:MAG: energy-coupling factor transporter transmembrane component T [Halobacteriales archaeon]|nr:energy-coupling factor transporter transmembrane component T [Halobacteriales archaeon]
MKRRVPVVYNDRDTWFHRRDPRAKIGVFVLMLLYMYVAPTWEWMLAMAVVGLGLVALARVPPLWIGALLALQLINVLGILAFPAIERIASGGTAFGGDFDYGLKLAFSWQAALLVSASLFTTMELTEITDGLRGLGIPELVCFTIEYIFLLFYVTISDLFRIIDGMKVKGLGIETRNPIKFASNMPSLAVPMFMSVLQRSNTMMSVLQMRGYSLSNENRELRHDLKFDAGDATLLGVGIDRPRRNCRGQLRVRECPGPSLTDPVTMSDNTDSVSTPVRDSSLLSIDPSTAEGRSKAILFGGLAWLAIGHLVDIGFIVWGELQSWLRRSLSTLLERSFTTGNSPFRHESDCCCRPRGFCSHRRLSCL